AFAGGRYPFDNEEIREIIRYAWKTIWPEAKEINRDTLPEIELVTMSLQDWWKRNQDSTLNS
ncbi:MAG: hypothetical protein JNK65_00080, partial [Deltaproteobacteria bacterium]|nr:hypothetical protein [Deltaproteobacteria bacterium]